METTRLSTKGQIVLPLRHPVGRFPETDLELVAGCLQYQGKPKTLKQIQAAVSHEMKQRHDRSRY